MKTPQQIVDEFWGPTCQGAKLCTSDDLLQLVVMAQAEILAARALKPGDVIHAKPLTSEELIRLGSTPEAKSAINTKPTRFA